MSFVDSRHGGLYVAGSRVSLASIIHGFRSGESPETIQENFPTLSLAQVYGAIAWYLSNPAESEAYLLRQEQAWTELESSTPPLCLRRPV